MRAALAILGTILLVPFVLGFLTCADLMLNLPRISHWLERHANESAARLSAAARRSKPLPPTSPDWHYYRRTRSS